MWSTQPVTSVSTLQAPLSSTKGWRRKDVVLNHCLEFGLLEHNASHTAASASGLQNCSEPRDLCLPACLPACLPVCLSVSVSVSVSLSLSLSLSLCENGTETSQRLQTAAVMTFPYRKSFTGARRLVWAKTRTKSLVWKQLPDKLPQKRH